MTGSRFGAWKPDFHDALMLAARTGRCTALDKVKGALENWFPGGGQGTNSACGRLGEAMAAGDRPATVQTDVGPKAIINVLSSTSLPDTWAPPAGASRHELQCHRPARAVRAAVQRTWKPGFRRRRRPSAARHVVRVACKAVQDRVNGAPETWFPAVRPRSGGSESSMQPGPGMWKPGFHGSDACRETGRSAGRGTRPLHAAHHDSAPVETRFPCRDRDRDIASTGGRPAEWVARQGLAKKSRHLQLGCRPQERCPGTRRVGWKSGFHGGAHRFTRRLVEAIGHGRPGASGNLVSNVRRSVTPRGVPAVRHAAQKRSNSVVETWFPYRR